MGTPKGTTNYSKIPSLGLTKHDPTNTTSGVYGKSMDEMDKNEKSKYGYLVTYRLGHDNTRTTGTSVVGWGHTKKNAFKAAQEFMRTYPNSSDLPDYFYNKLKGKSWKIGNVGREKFFYKTFIGTFVTAILDDQPAVLNGELMYGVSARTNWERWKNVANTVLNRMFVKDPSGRPVDWNPNQEDKIWVIKDQDRKIEVF